MDKCREALEAQFANSPELRDGHITWWDESNSYIAKTEAFQESADYWNKILNAWRLRQPDIDLLEAKVEELEGKLKQAYEDVDTFAEAHERECGFKAQFAKEKEEQLKINTALNHETIKQREQIKHYMAKYSASQKLVAELNQHIKRFELKLDEVSSDRQGLVGQVDELQKRVDAALELMKKPVIVGEPTNYVCARFKEIDQALKGEG